MSMRPTSVRISSTTPSNWVPLNRYPTTVQIMLGLLFSSNADMTVDVQYTTDPLVGQSALITRSTTTATVKLTNHGLSAGDSVVVSGAGSTLDGTFAVASVTDQNTFTYTCSNAGGTSFPDCSVIPLRVLTHPVLAGVVTTGNSGNQASNFNQPPSAVRLKASSWTAGYADLTITSGGW